MFDLNRADYHMHSYYSDGEFSPEYVIEKFAKLGYKNLAIMDHDGIDGVLEAEKKAKELGINYRRGLEFSTRTEKFHIGIHVLGYDIDITNEKLLARLAEIRKWREERNNQFFSILEDMGMPITMADLQMRENQTFIGKPIFARALLEKGYIDDFTEAFGDKVFGSKRLKEIKKKTISTREAIELITEAGGIPVLAHPGLIKHIGERESEEFFSNIEKMIEEAKKAGLMGMECIYSKHSEYEKERFCEIANKYDLYITKGADFHNERDERLLKYIEDTVKEDM